MLQNPELALDLPFRVLISQQPDGLPVGFQPGRNAGEIRAGYACYSGTKKTGDLVEQSIASID